MYFFRGHNSNILHAAFLLSPNIPVEVQRAFLRDPNYGRYLRINTHLAPELVSGELTKKLSVDEMMGLTSRKLSREQMSTILKRERRVSVLRNMVLQNPPATKAEAKFLVENSRPNAREFLSFAYQIVQGRKELARIVGRALSGPDLLYYLADSLTPETDLVRRAIDEFLTCYMGDKYKVIEMRRLFDLHAEMVDVCIDHTSALVREAMASSIGLSETNQIKLLGLGPGTVGNLTPGSYFIRGRDHLIYKMVRNVVVTPRVLSIIENASNASDATTRALRRRRRMGIGVINPEFKGITDEQTKLLSELSKLPNLFSPRKLYDGRVSYNGYNGWWMAKLVENAPASSASFLHDELTKGSAGSYSRILGPVRVDHMLRRLKRLTPGVKDTESVCKARTAAMTSDDFKRNPLVPWNIILGDAKDELIQLAYTTEVNQRFFDPRAGGGAGEAIALMLGDDVDKWKLLAQIIENAGSSTLKDVLGVVTRLSR